MRPARPTQVDFIRREMSSSDVICLQEFWFDPAYETIFRSALSDDYEFHTVKRTGGKSDGVAVLLRRGKWDVRSSLGLSLSPVGDRVALVMHLRSQDGGSGVAAGEDIILVNTHLAFPHNALDRVNQMSQIEAVTETVEGVVRDAGLPTMTPRVVVGDLNVEETDPVCRHLDSNGFRSAFASLHREQRVITHRNHRGEEVSTGLDVVAVIGLCLLVAGGGGCPCEMRHSVLGTHEVCFVVGSYARAASVSVGCANAGCWCQTTVVCNHCKQGLH